MRPFTNDDTFEWLIDHGCWLGRIGWYSLMRSMQFRKWRLPKARVKRGEPF